MGRKSSFPWYEGNARSIQLRMDMTLQVSQKKDLHLPRKTWHFSSGSALAFSYFYFVPKHSMILFLSFLMGIYFIVEILRIKFPSLHLKMIKNWKWVLRDSEITGINTGIYYIGSSLLAIIFFPKLIAVLSILYLAWGDPFASCVGILYGKPSSVLNGKSWAGTLAGFLVCMGATILFIQSFSLSVGQKIILSLVGGIAGGGAELFTFKIDDNFTIPLVSGSILWIVLKIMGIL